MDNDCWGAQKAYQRDFFDGRYISSDVDSPPLERVAELYGAIVLQPAALTRWAMP